MPTCIHNTPVGTYCIHCARVVKSSQHERDVQHYQNAPLDHDCPICQRVRATIIHTEPSSG